MKPLDFRTITLFFLLSCFGAVYTKCVFGQSWQAVPSLPPNEQMKFIAVHPEKSLTFLAADGNLYASTNQGKDWKQVLRLGTKAEIYDLRFEPDKIFLLSSEGLFESKNNGARWKKIFSGFQGEQSVRSFVQDPAKKNVLYVGTERGLFVSRDNGSKWEKTFHVFDHHSIYDLKRDEENEELFLATNKGLYRMIPGKNHLDKVYALRTAASSEELEAEFEESETDPVSPSEKIKSIVITPSSSIVIVTEHGISMSEDEGNSWEAFPENGLPKTAVIDLVYSHSQKTFFLATEKSVYVYLPHEKRWKELSSGLSGQKIERFKLVRTGASENLYVTTKNSMFKMIIDASLLGPERIETFSADRWNLLMKLFYYEPTIGEIQKKAIRYANVHKNKTKKWQWASRIRALVPTFSVGKYFSTADSIDIDRGSTNEPDRHIVGPRDQSSHWNYDLNWNVSDLIWNTAQTAIDSREKLMVELRNDILNEATRLYYERRRAQIELILRPPQDSFEYASALLRIDELTANLDALTGGFVTGQLDLIYSKYPEFQTLWTLGEVPFDAKASMTN